MTGPQPMSPDELFELTARYHDFGHHRTGTPADLATTDWFFDRLAALGASLHRRRVPFDRYDASVGLVDADGGAIPCDAIFYEFVGAYEGDELAHARCAMRGMGNATAFDQLLAARDAPTIVVVEDGPSGQVVMPNRPVGAGDRPPAVIVPSDVGDRLEGATLSIDARLVDGACESSSATVGDGPPVTITTPLSGWFGCASERGSGIAVALDLVARLAHEHTVTVVACSGHELDHLGLDAWLDEASAADAIPHGPVIHLGASVGAASGGVLDPRFVLQPADVPSVWLADLRSIVAAANYEVVTVDDPWPGEGRNWRGITPDVLSFTGAGRWFHTAGDTPEVAISPEALAVARDALWAATCAFLGTSSDDASHDGTS